MKGVAVASVVPAAAGLPISASVTLIDPVRFRRGNRSARAEPSAAAATIFVVGEGQVRPAFLRSALRHLQLSRAVVVGAVLTKHDVRAANYGYGYGYSYGYGYGYGHAHGESTRSDTDPRGLIVSNPTSKPPPQLKGVHGNA